MDYKEKYDNSIKFVELLIDNGLITREEASKYIPELEESEDERVRKQLLEFLCELSKLGKNINLDKWNKADCSNWVIYLEKQKPAEWSEKDKKTIHLACEFIKYNSNSIASICGVDCPTLIERLRNLHPQNHWKPTEKQLKVLSIFAANMVDPYYKGVILDLLEQLKIL